jgi:hypothetical protein
VEYMVRTGDTLQSIAQRLLGDAQLWMDIADSNSLTYPYISDVTSEGSCITWRLYNNKYSRRAGIKPTINGIRLGYRFIFVY